MLSDKILNILGSTRRTTLWRLHSSYYWILRVQHHTDFKRSSTAQWEDPRSTPKITWVDTKDRCVHRCGRSRGECRGDVQRRRYYNGGERRIGCGCSGWWWRFGTGPECERRYGLSVLCLPTFFPGKTFYLKFTWRLKAGLYCNSLLDMCGHTLVISKFSI